MNLSKKVSIAFGGLIVIAVIVGIVFLVPNLGEENGSDALRFQQEYEELNSTIRDDGVYMKSVQVPSDNMIKYVTIEEALEFSETGTGVVFLGAGWCRLCRITASLIAEASSSHNIPIHYVSLKRFGGSSGEVGYQELAELVGEYMRGWGTAFANVTGSESTIISRIEEIQDGEYRMFAGILLFYNKGTLTGMNVGTIEGHYDVDTLLNSQQEEKFLEMFDRHMEVLGTDPCPPGC